MGVIADSIGTFQGMAAANAEGKTERQVDMVNAETANDAANDASRRGDYQAGLARMKGSQVESRQTTAFAASGVDTQAGSALTAASGEAAMSELNAQTIRNNAAREAWGYKVKALNWENQSKIDWARAQNKKTATLLSGTAKEWDDIGSLAKDAG